MTNSLRPLTSDRTVRVFISSTFSDMHAERDMLVTVVFPELRERMEQLGLDFFDVDLRWGVPETNIDGERANSWTYCKQWIERVEPFFICMLGQRYGYVPPQAEIHDPDDWKAYGGLSITEMEVRHAVLTGRHRRRSYFYFRGAEVPAADAHYLSFVDPMAQERLRVLKADISNSLRPVRTYPCRWGDGEFMDLDDFGASVLEDLWSGVLRDERYVSKDAWRAALGHDPDDDPIYTDDAAPIPAALWERIVEQARPAPADPLDAEAARMAAFAAGRLRWFQGRSRELGELKEFIEASPPEGRSRLCVVRAEAGAGKSALMARLAELLASSPHLVLTHFVGATERSADVRSLFERLIGELDRHGIFHPDEPEPKLDLQSLKRRFAARVEAYVGERRIVILLDGINQLTDGHDLQWLPVRLGDGVRVVVSCIDDPTAEASSPQARVIAALDQRRPVPERVRVSGLAETDIREIVDAFLREYCKELDPAERDTIAEMPQARNPLYLLVMLQELRTLGGEDVHLAVRGIVRSLQMDRPDARSLFDWMLSRLEPPFGVERVRHWWAYLLAGRAGMSGRELSDLLGLKFGPGGAKAALRIERSVRRYLQRRGRQWDVFHGQLREAAVRRYDLADSVAYHADIAAYLETRWREKEVHAISELPHHETCGELWDPLGRTLCDLAFIGAKCAAGLTFDLVRDYNAALHALPEAQKELQEGRELNRRLVQWTAELVEYAKLCSVRRDREARTTSLGTQTEDDPQLPEVPASHRIWTEEELAFVGRRDADSPARLRDISSFADFVRADAYPLAQFAARDGFVAQQAWNHASGPVHVAAHVALSTSRAVVALRRSLQGSEATTRQKPTLQASLEGHTSDVTGVALTADGRRAVSASADGTLRSWDLATGACLHTFRGHTSSIRCVGMTPDGLIAISGSADRTLRVWDLAAGTCLGTIEGHTGAVLGVALTPDGRHAISTAGYGDRTIRVWDLATGSSLHTLGEHTDDVLGVAISPDGRLAVSGGEDGTVRMWDLSSGACRHVLVGHTNSIRCVAMSPDGRYAVSGSRDRTLRLWDLETGACLNVVEGQTEGAWSVTMTPDGVYAVSGDASNLRVWNLWTGACVRTLTGHTDVVWSVAVTADGRRAVSGSADGTVRMWDLVAVPADQSALQLGYTSGTHASVVRSVAVTPDGRLAVSGGDDYTLRIWDPATATCERVLQADTGMVQSTALTQDGRFAVTGGTSFIVHVWDLATGTEWPMLETHREWVESVAITLDGSHALSLSRDSRLKVWDAATGACLRTLTLQRTLPLQARECLRAAVTPDWQQVIAADGLELRVWDLETGICVRAWQAHAYQITSVAVAPDGRSVLSGGADMTVRLWDLSTGACRVTLEGHTAWVASVAILPDGRHAVSGSADRTLRLWDLATGECRATASLAAPIESLAVAADLACVGLKTGEVFFFDLRGL